MHDIDSSFEAETRVNSPQSERAPGEKSDDTNFLVTWRTDDRQNPQNWSPARKWSIVVFLCLVEILVSALSSAYSSGIQGVEADFGITQQVALLGQSLFVVGLATAPLLLGPLSEIYGRQPVYIGSLFVIVVFQIPAAYNYHPWTLIIVRFFAGCAASVPLTNTGGSVADMFDRSVAGYPVALFAFAGIAGPPMGPIMSGFIYVQKGWRWIFWVFMILLGACLIIQICLIPETKHNILLARRAKRLRKSTGEGRYVADGESDTNPFVLVKNLLKESSLMLVSEPIIAALGLYNAYLYGIVYIFFEAYPLVFGQNHGWNSGETGLAFLGIVVGALVGLAMHPIFERRYRLKKKNTPEDRLEGSLVTGFLLPVALFWFAWTSKQQIPPLIPIFAGIPFGIGAFYIYYGVVNHITDSYTSKSSSGLAAVSFVRSSFGAGFTHIAPPMYAQLGYTWATAALGFIALPLLLVPWTIWYFGPSLRKKSAMTEDP